MPPVKHFAALISLATIAGAGIGTVVSKIRHGSRGQMPAAPHVLAVDTRTVRATRDLNGSIVIDRLHFTAHGGPVVVEWYCGAVNPLVSAGSDLIALNIDGRELAATIQGAIGGQRDVRAGILRWVGRVATGPHVASIKLESARRSISLPLDPARAPVQQVLSVAEYAG